MSNTYSIDFELSSSQYGKANDNAYVSITGDITIELWMKLEQLPSTAGTQFTVVNKSDAQASNLRSWYTSIGTDDKFYVFYSADGTSTNQTIIATDAAFAVGGDVGAWVHGAISVDVSAKTGTFYKNGSSVATSYVSGTDTAIHDNASNFTIGCIDSLSTARLFFDGKIDEVRLWDDIRTAQEISDNYQNEIARNEAGLVGYWKFNEGTGTSVIDSSTNSTTLTLVNTPAWSTDVPFRKAAGNSMFFSGGLTMG